MSPDTNGTSIQELQNSPLFVIWCYNFCHLRMGILGPPFAPQRLGRHPKAPQQAVVAVIKRRARWFAEPMAQTLYLYLDAFAVVNARPRADQLKQQKFLELKN
jgi:hypothetical protein